MVSDGLTEIKLTARSQSFLLQKQFEACIQKQSNKILMLNIVIHHFSRKDVFPLPTGKTEAYPLGPIMANEGTINRTYDVHDINFEAQLKFKRENNFKDSLFLVYGDQKTGQLIRPIKLEQRPTELDYDRRDCLLGILLLRKAHIYKIKCNDESMYYLLVTYFDSINSKQIMT